MNQAGVLAKELLEEEGGQCGGSLDNIMNFTGLFFFLKPVRFLSLISMTGIRTIVSFRREKKLEDTLNQQVTVFIVCVAVPALR